VATSWLDVTDTAIKIGLGALIAGIFSIFLIFATSFRDRLSDRRNRRLKHLEDALSHAERHLNYLIKHAASAAWHFSTDLNASDTKEAKKDYELSKSRWDAGADDLNTATWRLMLVNQESISDRLRDTSVLADKLLQKIEAGGTYDEQLSKFDAFKTEVGGKRREVMRLLRDAYGA